ncbi:MAG: cytoplasmic filament protein CfpA, partial [Spirochaetota bacterium]
RLKYYDQAQLLKERDAYDKQMEEFTKEIGHLWDVIEIVYEDDKSFLRVTDFDDLAKKAKNKIKRRIKSKTGDPLYEDMKKNWNEIMYLKPEDTDVEKLNRTYTYHKTLMKKMLRKSRDKVQTIFGYRNPRTRVILDERVDHLEKEFESFDYLINPYHIQPGLILDVDISSIKRKKFTLNGMANVLNEFLHGVSKGFQDAAFAAFTRRRSTLREDIGQSFAAPESTAGRTSYSEAMWEERGKSEKEPGVKGQADVTPPKKKKKGKSDMDDLKEL